MAESLITNLTLECIYIWGNEHEESACKVSRLIDKVQSKNAGSERKIIFL